MRAKLRQQRSGASAPPRPTSVMLLCICFINHLSMFTSYVRRRPFPPIRSQSTKVGSYATSQAFWCTRTLEEHDGARFAEGPACRRPSRTSSSAACSRCRCGRVDGFSRLLDHGVVGRFRRLPRSPIRRRRSRKVRDRFCVALVVGFRPNPPMSSRGPSKHR